VKLAQGVGPFCIEAAENLLSFTCPGLAFLRNFRPGYIGSLSPADFNQVRNVFSPDEVHKQFLYLDRFSLARQIFIVNA
jgi:hypothetical protein